VYYRVKINETDAYAVIDSVGHSNTSYTGNFVYVDAKITECDYSGGMIGLKTIPASLRGGQWVRSVPLVSKKNNSPSLSVDTSLT